MPYSIEEQAQDLLEFSTEEQWASLYPADCTTPEQKANWCMLNMERFTDMATEAPFVTSKVLELLAEKWGRYRKPETALPHLP